MRLPCHCWCSIWSRSCPNSNCRANSRTDWQARSASRSGDDSKCSAARIGRTLATLFGIVTLLLGASGIFGQLQEALNTIWNVRSQPGLNIKNFLQKRLLSFAIVLVIGFLLIVSLVVSAVLAAIANFFGHLFPGWIRLGQILNFVFSLGGTTVLFALIYKVLPDLKIAWSNLWIGAFVTALLFNFGKFLIGLYLGNSTIGSSYGAASSLVIVLIWFFFSAQILLLGAEFTQVYTQRRCS